MAKSIGNKIKSYCKKQNCNCKSCAIKENICSVLFPDFTPEASGSGGLREANRMLKAAKHIIELESKGVI